MKTILLNVSNKISFFPLNLHFQKFFKLIFVVNCDKSSLDFIIICWNLIGEGFIVWLRHKKAGNLKQKS